MKKAWQDKGHGPTGPKSLSAHHFLWPSPILGVPAGFTFSYMLWGIAGGPLHATSLHFTESLI